MFTKYLKHLQINLDFLTQNKPIGFEIKDISDIRVCNSKTLRKLSPLNLSQKIQFLNNSPARLQNQLHLILLLVSLYYHNLECMYVYLWRLYQVQCFHTVSDYYIGFVRNCYYTKICKTNSNNFGFLTILKLVWKKVILYNTRYKGTKHILENYLP